MFRGEQDRQPAILSSEIQLRERLSTADVDTFLSFFGNSEIKIAMLVSMDPSNTYSGKELYDLLPHSLIQQPAEGNGWKITQSLPLAYCEDSFIPVGLVEKGQDVSRRFAFKTVATYRKTQDGVEIGDAFGGLLMSFSHHHPEVSLYQLLGATNSSARTITESEEDQSETIKRQPAIRRRFYQTLLAEDTILPKRVIDIATQMKERTRLIAHYAKSAGENNIIVFKSIEHGAPISAYRFSPKAEEATQPAFYREGYFPQVVYQVLKDNPQRWWTIEEVANLLLKTRPTGIIRDINEHSRRTNMRNQAANTLSGLRYRGHVILEKLDRSSFSSINVTPEQRALLQEFLVYIDAFQNQDPQALVFGRSFVQYLRENPPLLAQLVLKGRGTSPHAGKNADTTAANINATREAIRTHPNMTVSQLHHVLRNKYRVNLSDKRIRMYLEAMKETGTITSYPDKSGMRWRLSHEAIEE